MSADAQLVASDRDDERAERCRAPNCWRDGSAVRVDGETAVSAVLCDEHIKVFLGVSS